MTHCVDLFWRYLHSRPSHLIYHCVLSFTRLVTVPSWHLQLFLLLFPGHVLLEALVSSHLVRLSYHPTPKGSCATSLFKHLCAAKLLSAAGCLDGISVLILWIGVRGFLAREEQKVPVHAVVERDLFPSARSSFLFFFFSILP